MNDKNLFGLIWTKAFGKNSATTKTKAVEKKVCINKIKTSFVIPQDKITGSSMLAENKPKKTREILFPNKSIAIKKDSFL